METSCGVDFVWFLRGVLDDHAADQRDYTCRSRGLRRYGAAGEERSVESGQCGDRYSSWICDSGCVAAASELDQSRERFCERVLVVGAGGLWCRRQDVQRCLLVRAYDAT